MQFPQGQAQHIALPADGTERGGTIDFSCGVCGTQAFGQHIRIIGLDGGDGIARKTQSGEDRRGEIDRAAKPGDVVARTVA